MHGIGEADGLSIPDGVQRWQFEPTKTENPFPGEFSNEVKHTVEECPDGTKKWGSDGNVEEYPARTSEPEVVQESAESASRAIESDGKMRGCHSVGTRFMVDEMGDAHVWQESYSAIYSIVHRAL